MMDIKQTHRATGLIWPDLISGVLKKRYKRFLADVSLPDGSLVTAHCPNSGSMTASCEPGRPVYLSLSDNPKRKLKYTWELIEMPTSLVGVNTLVPNRLVFHEIQTGHIPPLAGYDALSREVKVGAHSRLDLMLENTEGERCYVEVKNCTLVEGKIARFPDAVTERGRKHLSELQKLVRNGDRCMMFYLIQRMDAVAFKPADDIDPAYGKALRQAVKDGVEILAYDVKIDLKRIRIGKQIPIVL
jgi:sugar fermentation stimulation protein A